jgi:dTDP-4-amino-4,6-dideoxygalactose transaminase
MRRIIRNKFVLTTACERDAVATVLDGKTLSGTSPLIAEYEAALANLFGAPHAVACSSGTSALYAALLALGVNPGDEIAVPPTAPVMTVLPVLALGARPLFVDTAGSNRFGLSAESLSRALTVRTKAVVVVPMWGYPSWEKDVEELCRHKGIPILEDAAQAHGSMTRGAHAGTLGTLGCFSTHERKLICTGEGGFVLARDRELDGRLREICLFGRQIIARKGFEQYAGKFGVAFGLNLKLNSLAAAVGMCQLPRLEERISVRTRNAARLREGLGKIQWLSEFFVDPADRPNYYSIVFEVDPAAGSGRKAGAVLAEAGIVADTFEYDYMSLYELPIFRDFARPCPNAEELTDRAIALPTHEGLTADDIDYMISIIAKLNPK